MEVHAAQRPDGAEMFFGTVKSHDINIGGAEMFFGVAQSDDVSVPFSHA
jgi:hypothetical protein